MSDSLNKDRVVPEQYILMTIYSLLAITGLLGNLWVIMTVSSQLLGCGIAKGRPSKSVLQTSAYIYLFVLSMVDLLSLLPVPILVVDIYENRFPFPEPFCKFLYICECTNKTLSPFILTALSVDRYIAVCHPTLLWLRQTFFSTIIVFLCCFFSLFFIVPIAISANLGKMIDANFKTIDKCTIDDQPTVFDMLHALCSYLIPLMLICGVYLAILRKLYKHTRYSTVGHKTSISLSRVIKCSLMVVAFYFGCWTPYWGMRIHRFLVPDKGEQSNCEEKDPAKNETSECDKSPPILSTQIVFFMYLLHTLPYAQSAFNWLFYAFLNRNLRNSTIKSCTSAFRSMAGASTIIENGNTGSTGFSPLWKNIQSVGSQIKSASIDTGNVIRKMSPFRQRSQIASRSTTYLDVSYGDHLAPPSNPLISSSMLDIPRRPSLMPRTEPSLVGKALSYSDLPRSAACVVNPSTGDANSTSGVLISESSSVEWL